MRNLLLIACSAFALTVAAGPFAGVASAAANAASVGQLLHVTQTLNNCGPASVAEVLDYWGIEKSQNELRTILRRGGALMSTDDVADYVAGLGLREFIGNEGAQGTIKALIDHGLPVIVAQDVSLSDPLPHFRPIQSYDDASQQFVASDPLMGAGYRIGYGVFDRLWDESTRTFLVIYPPSKQQDLESALADSGFDGASWMTPFD